MIRYHSVSPLVIVKILYFSYLFIYSSFFLPDFVHNTSLCFNYSIIMKISMINNLHLKFLLKTFHSNQSWMTSSRRHFVFFRFCHLILHIFRIVYYLIIPYANINFRSICSAILYSWAGVREDVYIRASQNFKMLKNQLWSI